MNLALFNWINNFAGRWAWLDRIGIFCTEYLGWILVAILLILFFWRRYNVSRRGIVVSIISAIVARLGFMALIKYFYHNPRPFEVIKVHQLIPENGWSFPSGHASFYFALAMGVYMYNPKLGRLYFLGAAIISIARVFAGVHWPADIIGGVGLGILTAMLVDWIVSKFWKLKNPGSAR